MTASARSLSFAL